MRVPVLLTTSAVLAWTAPAEAHDGPVWGDEVVDLNVVSVDIHVPGGVVVANRVDR
ncbi:MULTISPECIES: hypothetical protein [unclassified Nocardiopsis]|uniref:hypothetical protein n=1 Tax=unclassified Nocardiopsis TaxID=2649073 RepID=UPI0013596B26|nr:MULTISPECIES: hypothetical protein [unclassified Nocardiopsis]